MRKICHICKEEFFVAPSRNKRFCSFKCYWEWRKLFYIHSKETRRKIGLAHKGMKRPQITRDRMSKNRKGKGKGSRQHCWKGGKFPDKDGYILILKPEHPFCDKSGYVREHRLIVEQQINRFLKPIEQSHHLNGIKDDNRPKNLMAFVNNSAHKRFHKNPNNVKLKEIIFDGHKLYPMSL